MIWKAEISYRPGMVDAAGEGIRRDIEELGVEGITSVRVVDVYRIEGEITQAEMEEICRSLLTDDVLQCYTFEQEGRKKSTPAAADKGPTWTVEVAYNPGVMDPVQESARKGIRDLGIKGVRSVRTAKKYLIWGSITAEQIQLISESLLANVVIQHVVIGEEQPARPTKTQPFQRIEVDLLDADDDRLMRISRERVLSLTVEEMRTIQAYFQGRRRNPTDVELETLAQTWSEHCVHKTLKGLIEYKDADTTCPMTIDNLLKSTVMRATRELNKSWCVSVFEDNAGIIEFDDRTNICFKVETHNHPSAIEPYGGAETGIGGVIRDILGAGLGAKPIVNTDVFCFGPLDIPRDRLPKGVLHPRRIMKGVVAGVRDYGNRMGIPTANGAIFFDEGYIGNPLVYCGNVGIMPKDKCRKQVQAGDRIVVVGGRTGRDGIHGATFSSDELSEGIYGGVVQIGNAITEKKMMDVLLQVRDLGLYEAITDCGAGGLSSAVGEMGEALGALVDLEKVPLKYEGLAPWEIWVSEAQERMVLAVPSENVDRLIALFAREDVEATDIGVFMDDRRLRLRYRDHEVCDLDMAFLHNGYPQLRRQAIWEQPIFEEPNLDDPPDLTSYLKQILSAPNVCSKEWVIRQYDHEVQGGSVLKPLVGVQNDGPGDACVIQPLFDSKKGVILSNGLNPQYGKIDPYHMAASAIDEALRQIIAVGGSLERTALLDNFCWGNPAKPDRLGGLVRAAMACYDIATIYGTPFISGKDSLNNEVVVEGESIPIPPTLLISAISVMEDIENTISMDLKEAGDLVYVVGRTYDELGGSHYYRVQGYLGNNVPQVRAEEGKGTMEALSNATAKGLVCACHDCSEGGLGVAATEMAFAGEVGLEIELNRVPRSAEVTRNDAILFSESNSRFLVEVPPENRKAFEAAMAGTPFAQIGRTTEEPLLIVRGTEGHVIVHSDLMTLKECWQAPMREI